MAAVFPPFLGREIFYLVKRPKFPVPIRFEHLDPALKTLLTAHRGRGLGDFYIGNCLQFSKWLVLHHPSPVEKTR